ncbi:uncharacterized protein LOC127790840 isoform X2 [Diospyros lotus]|nr:uncharacterized protein LOC127790840 isoform X2 [Diospyros lotus]
MLFEQARKNMYCSRCNGLLLEGFFQIVMYGKSLQQDGASQLLHCNKQGPVKLQNGGNLGITDDVQDPSVHPWGGLITTRDGALTLLDCYLCSRSLKGLQIVFDSARARERERELLYPDACGGGGRGWISQAAVGYGRAHGTREACALHTARLSVDTLVDFWSALGEETQKSLLRMKEDDFIERLIYRFDSKRFCRDCRRNVIRGFKELKELKRLRKDPQCTSWFCVADTAFQYEVSHDTVQADWHQIFVDNVGNYHHFEWALGTADGKYDILEFENVGMSGRVQVSGLDLGGLNACYITLRAWKMDGRCTELSAKAHALKGQQCVHSRLAVNDGFVTITRGENIKRFFEHAEEAEEEEDDDSMDKDGNELDGECSRPQKHAKSPELAREFLLDAAAVIFKEQVEKAFREGTARQNAHIIFVCLALKLLEERVHVACKEIITLEKQMKLLEEEEKEKREEEERKERRRMKEREKKLRRKERMRGKEQDGENMSSELNQDSDILKEKLLTTVDEQLNVFYNRDSSFATCDITSTPVSPDTGDEHLFYGPIISNMENHSDDSPNVEILHLKDRNHLFGIDQSKVSHQNLKHRKYFQQDPMLKLSERQQFAVVSENEVMVHTSEPGKHANPFDITSKSVIALNKNLSNAMKLNTRNSGAKLSEMYPYPNNRMTGRYDSHACSCNQRNDYRAKVERHTSMPRMGRQTKSITKLESASDKSKLYYCGDKYDQVDFVHLNGGRPKGKNITGNNPTRDSHYIKKIWEPMESRRKYPRRNSDTDLLLQSSPLQDEGNEPNNLKTSDVICFGEVSEKVDTTTLKDNNLEERRNSSPAMDRNRQNMYNNVEAKAPPYSKGAVNEDVQLSPVRICPFSGTSPSVSSSSTSDNCSSCLSEGDNNTASSNSPNSESLSSLDSEDVIQYAERTETACVPNDFNENPKAGMEKRQREKEAETFKSRPSFGYSSDSNFPINLPTRTAHNLENGIMNVSVGSQHTRLLPPMHNQHMPLPVFQAPTTGYYHQNPVPWPSAPANGLMPFPHPNHYIFASPLGYGLNGNSRFMQYGTLQHFTPPVLNPVQVSIYQPVVKTNGVNSGEQTKTSKPGGMPKSSNEPKMERSVPAGHHPLKEHPSDDDWPNGNKISDNENSGFSLFHFGGPVALSARHKLNSVPPKDGILGNLSPDSSAQPVEHVRACNKKDTMEEYNLFAASNGIRFSFL